MTITMLISLYTSRVVLNALGFVDYGLYNVVGGVVVFFTFLNGSLSSATQRFLNYGIGKNEENDDVDVIYSTSIIIHIIISMIIILLAETIGLWFVYNKLVIPTERFEVCFWVYQFSIISCICSIIGAPYQALIIANERMDAYACISICESLLKLAVALLIASCQYDHLFAYAILLMLISLLVLLAKFFYCKIRLFWINFRIVIRRDYFYKIGGFSAWNLIGSLALVGVNQGSNILLNLFFGPVVNAARAVAVQVRAAINGFSMNIQTAFNPQIVKTYAASEFDDMHYLLIKSAKFSFLALFIISLPVLIEIDYILHLWLKEVPNYSSVFITLLVIISLIDSTTGALTMSVNATGKIRDYQLTVGLIILSIIPISYLLLRFYNLSPLIVFIVMLIVDIIAVVVRMKYCQKQLKMNVIRFIKEVYGRGMAVVLISVPLPCLLRLTMDSGIMRLIVVFIVSVIVTLFAIYRFGITQSERITVKCYIINYLIKN